MYLELDSALRKFDTGIMRSAGSRAYANTENPSSRADVLELQIKIIL